MNFPATLARWVTRWPLAVAGIVLANVVAALLAIAFVGLRSDFTPQALFTTFKDQAVIDEAFEEVFGETDNVMLVVIEAEDVLAQPVLQYAHDLALEIEGYEGIDRVEAPTISAIPRAGGVGELVVDSPVRGDRVEPEEVEELREAFEASQLFDGVLVSESRNTLIVAAFLGEGLSVMEQLRPVADRFYRVLEARPPPEGVRARIAGLPHIRVYVAERIIEDQKLLVPISAAVSLLMLWLAFRWFAGAALAGTAVGFSMTLAIGLMAFVREPLNIINNILPVLLIVIGMSDGIHLISRFGEESSERSDKREAAFHAVRTMTAACFLTSFTTAIGFASLLVSRTEILRRFGVTFAIGVMIAYVVTILFLPVGLMYAPKPPADLGKERDGLLERVAVGIVGAVIRRPRWALALSGGVVAIAALIGARVPVDTFLMESFPERSEIYEMNTLLEEEMNGVMPLEVSLEAQETGRFQDPDVLNAVDDVQRWLDAREEVLSTRSYSSVLREAWVAYSGDPEKRQEPWRSRAQIAQLTSLLEGGDPDPLTPWVTFERDHVRINANVADVGSRKMQVFIADLRPVLDEAFAPFDDIEVNLTGDAFSATRGLQALIGDMLSSLGLAVVFIFGILSLLFRSLRLGILSVPANVTPLIVTLAYMALTGTFLNTTTVIIFSVSIGLAVDDTIHVLARFREEMLDGADLDTALLRTARGAGRAILITTVMFLAGMSVILLSSFIPVRLFAELLMVTLLGCILGDLILLPALLKLFWKEGRPPVTEGASPSEAGGA